MKINKNEFEEVSKLTAFERYKYFIKRVADFEVMYTLVNANEDLALLEVEGKRMLSFWSSKEFAASCAINEWHGYQPIELTLEQFEESYIDIIEAEDYLINIFPSINLTGFIVDIAEFTKDLNEEMQKYH